MGRAALPEGSYSQPENILRIGKEVFVRCFPEAGGTPKDFEFHRLGLAPDLETAVVEGFARACGPAGSRRTTASVTTMYAGVRVFARSLNELPSPPTGLQDLAAGHVAPFRIGHTRYLSTVLNVLRVTFRNVEGLPKAFREALYAPHGPAISLRATASYSEIEVRNIQRATRVELKKALARIRQAEAETTSDKGSETHLAKEPAVQGVVSRPPEPQLTLYPSYSEVTAVAILMISVSGYNLSTVCGMKTEHTRADDQESEETIVLTRGTKPRRGPRRAEMDLSLTPGPERRSNRDDYTSASGVYRIALELCANARAAAGTNDLLVFYSSRSGRVAGSPKCRPLPDGAIALWRGRTPDGQTIPRVLTRRLRLAFIQRHQRPMAHSAATAAREYLTKDATALPQYQAIVHDALTKEVDRLRLHHKVLTLSESQVREAQTDPGPVAATLGTNSERLEELLEGRLDTVVTACVDETNSPYNPTGSACTASFLLCLGCPNARSEPRHMPLQRAMKDSMERRKAGMSEHHWQGEFSVPHQQLTDLLARQETTRSPNDTRISDQSLDLIELVLDGGLDIK